MGRGVNFRTLTITCMSIPNTYSETREMNTEYILECSKPTVRQASARTPFITLFTYTCTLIGESQWHFGSYQLGLYSKDLEILIFSLSP